MASNQRPKPSRKIIADALKEATAYLFFRYRYSVAFELGVEEWGRRRADVVANKVNGHVVIVECKSCKADLANDYKWPQYVPFSNQFYFSFTPDTYDRIKADPELVKRLRSPHVGVILLLANGYARIVKRSKIRETSPEIKISMLARLAWRAGDLSKRTRRSRKRVYLPDL